MADLETIYDELRDVPPEPEGGNRRERRRRQAEARRQLRRAHRAEVTEKRVAEMAARNKGRRS